MKLLLEKTNAARNYMPTSAKKLKVNEKKMGGVTLRSVIDTFGIENIANDLAAYK